MNYLNFDDVPWYRRSTINNVFVFLGLIGLIPFAIFTAYLLLTGNVYFNQKRQDGTLKTWGIINKIWAIIIVLFWSFVFLSVFINFIQGNAVVKFCRDRYQAVMPYQWEWRSDLSNSGLDLQIGNESKNAYCRILEVEDTQDFDLKTLSEGLNSVMVESLEDLNTSQPTSLLLNGHPAIQYEFAATKDGIRIKYWQVFVELNQEFLMAILWSTESQFEQNRSDFERIIQSIDIAISSADD
tara:strand:+ start:104 stop:823 length:720 start_codon:yes stop_codon:yes gene_type:complete